MQIVAIYAIKWHVIVNKFAPAFMQIVQLMSLENNLPYFLIPSFHGNYSFLNLEIKRSQYTRPKVTVHKGAETIQGRKLYEEIRYIKCSLFQDLQS